MKKMTLNKLLLTQGFGTRRACEQMIVDGRVSVAGEIVTEYIEALQAESLELEVNGQA